MLSDDILSFQFDGNKRSVNIFQKVLPINQDVSLDTEMSNEWLLREIRMGYYYLAMELQNSNFP